jgi:hypothetical protein
MQDADDGTNRDGLLLDPPPLRQSMRRTQDTLQIETGGFARVRGRKFPVNTARNKNDRFCANRKECGEVRRGPTLRGETLRGEKEGEVWREESGKLEAERRRNSTLGDLN